MGLPVSWLAVRSAWACDQRPGQLTTSAGACGGPQHPRRGRATTKGDTPKRRSTPPGALSRSLALQITRPERLTVAPELIEVFPRVKPGIMAIVKYQLHGILTDGLHSPDAHVLLTCD